MTKLEKKNKDQKINVTKLEEKKLLPNKEEKTKQKTSPKLVSRHT